ncbi:DUF2635 domain-containing protein [Salmonella enterica subsp. enterica]|nr:DUF2635 domain-containing protein [Salmonella enterica subsp. enterica]EDR2888306.1 DUF2635 domain-containing protein [Salmonella enterica subsp. enterica]EDR6140827.1 DUF2635 domain-containing protein [Salmonella enterica subsp. enterica]EDU9860149.1 DUF2635 domain-containing protein [Salmonella enterica subsp. enterica]EDV0530435.1 DUF2635 domain-containing protein [Salmonella enterica subsp. enterica]
MKKVITPRAGVQVRKPDGKRLSPDGETLDYNAYWVRRRNDGDVTVADVPGVAADAALAVAENAADAAPAVAENAAAVTTEATAKAEQPKTKKGDK